RPYHVTRHYSVLEYAAPVGVIHVWLVALQTDTAEAGVAAEHTIGERFPPLWVSVPRIAVRGVIPAVRESAPTTNGVAAHQVIRLPFQQKPCSVTSCQAIVTPTCFDGNLIVCRAEKLPVQPGLIAAASCARGSCPEDRTAPV